MNLNRSANELPTLFQSRETLPVTCTLMIWLLFLMHQPSGAYGQNPNSKSPPIAESGGTEIGSIKILRQRIAGAAANADVTNMEVKLWFSDVPAATGEQYTMRLMELAEIKDDTGREVAPQGRRERMDFLNASIPVREMVSRDGKSGPIVALLLDAPARSASKLVSIKGKAVISRSSHRRLQFSDIDSMNRKPLVHDALADFPVHATVRLSDGRTLLKLEVPSKHERLIAWGLVRGNRMISSESESESLEDDGAILEADYDGDVTKDCSLGLMIAEPVESKLFEFEFKDVELP